MGRWLHVAGAGLLLASCGALGEWAGTLRCWFVAGVASAVRSRAGERVRARTRVRLDTRDASRESGGMFRGLRVIAMAPCFNEELKIGEVVRRVPKGVVDETLVIDDGSTDKSPEVARALGATVLPLGRLVGVGAALRAGYQYALAHGYDVAVVMAGNNKDSPEEIPVLLEPIADGLADFVQGSRFLKRHANFGPMPAYRKVATRVHPLLFSLAARRWVTESTNGFRAVHRRVLEDPAIDLDQRWLDEYELEPYLYLRAVQQGYRTVEVPVTKIYPPKKLGQTKMKPITGWWSILRPLVYVGLGLRR